MDTAIRVSNLTKIYKLYRRKNERLRDALHLLPKGAVSEKKALDNVSLEVKKGETVGIIGTNGSGKSTILKIITGVLSPSSGEVQVEGHISALLELGAGFNMEYNGIDNIYLNGMMIGFSEEEIDKRLDDILEFADIGEYVYQPVKTYSSGMFVRLAFAVAINIDPEILIVDEALSVGDVFFQAKCYRKFEEFKKAGKTIIFVSHDLSNISRYCDRVILLNKGVMLGEGSPKQMIDVYKQLLVGLDPDDAVSEESDNLHGDNDGSELLSYGEGLAEISEYYLLDEKGRRVNSIEKGSEFTVCMRVKFSADVAAPIFAFTIKNVQGVEICGTNTMVERAYEEPCMKGEVKEISFTQKMALQGGDYLVSFGITGFEQNDFKVYHRLYDALKLSVVSDKNTVGFYDMDSTIKVR